MSFFQARKGAELLRQWLLEESMRVEAPSMGGLPKLHCPRCKAELGAYFGRRSGVYRIHHYASSPHNRCPLEFNTWTGPDRSEAVSNLMEFSYAYRPEEPALESAQSDEPGAAAPAGEGGYLAIGSGEGEGGEGGEGSASDPDRIPEDTRDFSPGSPVWEEEQNA